MSLIFKVRPLKNLRGKYNVLVWGKFNILSLLTNGTNVLEWETEKEALEWINTNSRNLKLCK